MTVSVLLALALLGVALVWYVPAVPARYAIWLSGYPMYAGWIGYLIIRWESDGVGLVHHSVAMLFFGFGAFLLARTVRWPTPPERSRAVRPRSGMTMTVLLSLFAAYHFAVIGVPILSPNIDLLRWNFTGSGLAGIPGRAYSIGLPFMMVYSVIASNRADDRDREAWRRVRNVTIVMVFVTRVAGGFKGELLEMVVMLTITSLLSAPDRFRLPTGFKKRIVTGVLLALAAAVLISTQYYATEWNRENAGQSVMEQFLRRSTVMVAESGTTLIDMADLRERPFDRNSVVNDLDVYVGGTFNLWNVDGRFVLNQHLAARHFGRDILYGRELTFERFIVPVTPGFAAVAYFDFGWVGIAAVAMLVGLALTALARAALLGRKVAQTFAAVIAFEGIRSYVQKGELSYVVVNYTLVTVGLLVGLILIDHFLAGAAATSVSTPVLARRRVRHYRSVKPLGPVRPITATRPPVRPVQPGFVPSPSPRRGLAHERLVFRRSVRSS